MKKMLFILACLLPLFCAEAGNIITVDDDGGAADFTRIQDAIDAPGTTDGDTIVVHEGDYNENINFRGKALEIRSLYPEDPSIVQATVITASSGYSVTFDSGEMGGSVLTGLTITGRGIRCANSSPEISKNIITNCDNSGITCAGSSYPLIQDNVISFNSPSGIRLSQGAIIDNKITHNGPESGIYISYGDIIGNEISNNISTGNGGGIYICYGDILQNIIMNNEAGGNGGGISNSNNSGDTASNKIIGNKAGQRGGGIHASNGIVAENIIAGNRAEFGSAMADCGAEIHNNTITGNRVEMSGTLSQCYYYVDNNIIAFNEGPANMGGISGVSINSYNCFWENAGSHFNGGASAGEGDLIADPLFAQPGYWDANGTEADPDDDFWVEGDYHVLSEYGRWNAGILRWVYDGDTSPCIDAGLDYWDWKGEYWPHGKRINQGRYGGTSQASMSPNDVGNVADLNLDELVDFRDLMLLCEVWPYDWPLLREDLDRNGFIDLSDYAILVANWAPFPLPSPSPMTWEVEPYESSQGTAAMEASEAQSSDDTGVQYRFEEITGNPGGSDSGWISSRTYTDTGLSSGVEYCYRVQARNIGNNIESKFSEAVCIVVSSPPTPAVMTWATPPTADAFNRVSMTATTANSTDGSGVEYYFDCVSVSEGGHDREWADEPNYTDTVSENREYCYKVKARNKANKLETEFSDERCATTPKAPPPTPSPMTWASEPTAVSHSSITMTSGTATSADGVGVEYFFWNITRDPIPDVNNNMRWHASPTFTDTGLSKLTTYSYRVKARNLFNKAENEWSVERSATTPCDDSISPWFPGGIYWESEPCEEHHGAPTEFDWWGVMTAAEAQDNGSGILEYHFVCTNGPWSSGWQTDRHYEISESWGRSQQGFIFYVEARDECGNVSGRSPDVLVRYCQ